MKSLSLAALLLVCGMGVTAHPQDAMKSEKMAKKMTTVGCISEKDGKYLLTNKQHPLGVELSFSEDLKAHVGHKVKITGSMETAPMTAGDKMMPDDKMKMDDMKHDEKMASDDKMKMDDKMKSEEKMKMDDTMKRDEMPMMVLKVSSMKMLSSNCAADKMSK
ncbi:MAG: hypothetical protein PVS2B2_27270 [Candidatus Acidiferrum sp.]